MKPSVPPARRTRRFLRFVAIYAVVAWVCVEVGSVVFPELGFMPEWSVRFVIVLAILGLPLALLLVWATEPATVTPPRAAQPAQTRPHSNSIAVLPFRNIGGDAADEYFCDGLAEELLIVLSRVGALRVAARSSAFAFKHQETDVREIARQLGVANVVEGSVRRAGPRLRIGVRLIDAASGYQIWAQTYDREFGDIFAVQDDIARSVFDALRQRLGLEAAAPRPAYGTADVEAYDLYLMGRHQFHKRTEPSLQSAIAFFERAIERDPRFALPYSGLADAWLLLAVGGTGYGNVPQSLAIERAAPQVERALELAPQLAEAHASLGFLRRTQHDLAGSEQALRRATELDPEYAQAHVWLGLTLSDQGRLREAYLAHERAFEMDPLSPIVNTNLGFDHVKFGRLEEGRKYFMRVIEIDPRFPVAYNGLAQLERLLGRSDEALRWIRRAVEAAPTRAYYRCVLAAILLDRGDVDAAREAMAEAERLSPQRNWVLTQYQFALAVATNEFEPLQAQLQADGRAGHQWVDAYTALTHIFTGDAGRAVAGFEALGESKLLDGLTDYVTWGSGYPLAVYHGCALGLTGRHADKRDWLQRCGQIVPRMRAEGVAGCEPGYVEAQLAALDGRIEEALKHLEAAIEAGWHRRWWSEGDPALVSLRGRPAFDRVLDAMLPRS